MAKKTVTLYIDDTSIRMLLTQGTRIKKWADLPLEPGLVKNATVLKEAELAAKIKQLFQVRKIKTKKVNIGVSGLRCLSRPLILPQLPKVMLDEAVRREAKRVLPVPPEKLYLSWQSIPAPEGKSQVFLVAIPNQSADALFKMLRQAGLKPDLMDLKPLLLARAVKEKTAIILDVQPNEFDIVIMVNGIPQPIRTVSFPSETLSWQKKLPMIKNELNRTIEFYKSNNPEYPLAPDVPIFVSGEIAYESENLQSISDEVGHPVLPISPPMEYPAGLDPHRYMANIGLVLKKLSFNETGLSVTDLNVLPEVYQPEPISLVRILVVPAAVIAIGFVLLLGLLIQNTSSDTAKVRSQMDATNQLLQQKLAQKQKQADTLVELEKKINQAKTSGGNFAAAVADLEEQSSGFNGDLEVTISSLPSKVSLTSITHSSHTYNIKGRAPDEQEILSYLRELDASGRFSDITINSIRIAQDENMDFILVLKTGE